MSKMVDITNMKFGYLTVLKRAENNKRGLACWLCKCKCGNEITITGNDLRTGHTKSCGCSKENYAFDLSGKTFNDLTVIKRLENNKARHARWLCKCKCGNETTVTASRLVNGIIKSCGCLQKAVVTEMNKKAYGESAFRQLVNHYKCNAKIRNLEYSLSDEDTKELTSHNCSLCNKPPFHIIHKPSNNGDLIYTGIDRIDNTKGYIKENVRPCCGECNKAKGTLSDNVFLMKIKAIYENLELE